MIEGQKIDEKEKGKIVQIEGFLIIFTHTGLIRLVMALLKIKWVSNLHLF